ncbi:MAG: hypothetical protein AAF741_13495 [Bacteroidota bacterium]
MANNLKYLLALATLVVISSCERDLEDLEPASFPTTAEVFIDGFSAGLEYAAFGGSDVLAFQVDEEVQFRGTSSMRFEVPDFEDPAGSFAGGVFFDAGGRDLTGYTALTFWMRASRSANINELGLGNDLGANQFVATITNVPVNTNWRKYYIPIPDASKLTRERGMFWFAEGPEDEEGYTFWIDDVRYENLGTITPVESTIRGGEDQVVVAENGATFDANGTSRFNLPEGVDITVGTAPAYFEYSTTNEGVATVSDVGQIVVIGEGEATITATLAGEPSIGSLTVTSSGAASIPSAPAPTPTQDAQDVISIYSNAYTNEPIDFLNGFWQGSTTQSEELQIAGDDVVRYFNLNFVGIQFTAPTIDISEMTHIRMDIWTPEPTASGAFRIKLYDLGPNNAFDGLDVDDSEHEIAITAPTLQSEQWVSLDIPLSQFPGLTSRANLAQVILSGDIPTVFVDNVYFYEGEDNGGGGDMEPSMAAPAPPSREPGDVISLFSDAYDDVTVETFRTTWSQGGLENVSIAGNPVLKYTALGFVGIETMMAGNQLDITDMTHVHVDVWSPNFDFFAFKIVDAGANGTIEQMGDDVEDEVQYTMPTQGEWIQYDIPLDQFPDLTTREQISQYIFSAQPTNESTLFIDNLYFYREGSGVATEPTAAAPTPTRPAADVISLFSDAYNDVTVETFQTGWSSGVLENVMVGGDPVLKYTSMGFVGIETLMGANQLDISGMTHVHVDVWSPNFETFAFKIVDAGSNGTIDGPGTDDREDELVFPAPTQGQWLSYDIPLADFVDLTTREQIAQYIFSDQGSSESTFFIDNIYFYSE